MLQVLRDVLVWSEARTAREPRSLFTVAFAPAGVLFGLVAAISLVTLVSADSDLQGAFGAIALVWLAVHQVPISVADIALGALPLAPTALLMLFVARISAQAASTRPTHRELRQVLAAAMGGPLVITMILLATAKDAATVVPLNAPAPAPALAWVTGIHLVASGAGILWSRRAALVQTLPAWGSPALQLGARGGLWLFVLSGGLVVLNMVAHWSRLSAGFGTGAGVIGLTGVLVLSLLYLPNVMMSGIDVLLGATVRLGGTSVSLAHTHIGQLPLLPVFTPFVSWHFGKAAFAALAIPALVGAWLGGECARKTTTVASAVRAAATAAACASALVCAGSAVVCGKVGVIGQWSVNLPLVGLMAFALLAVPASVVAVAMTAPAALRHKPVPVVVISPAREQDPWQDSAEAEDATDVEMAKEAAEADIAEADIAQDVETGGAASESEGAGPAPSTSTTAKAEAEHSGQGEPEAIGEERAE